MKENIKYLLIGLIGAIIGNTIIFLCFSIKSDKYGTLADWVSGLGTVAAILFVYWQIEEQREEFAETRKYSLTIAVGRQLHFEEIPGGGKVSGDHDYYIWAVNNGMTVGSFKFLGFCKKEDYRKIDTDDVIFDPYNDGLQRLLPKSTNNFELLQPGQVSKEHIISENLILKRLGKSGSIFILYMDALGKIYSREVRY